MAPIPYAEAVFCSDDPVPAEDVAETGPAAQDATFTRGDNNDGAGGVTQIGCEDIGVTLQIDEDGVFLDKGTVGIFTGHLAGRERHPRHHLDAARPGERDTGRRPRSGDQLLPGGVSF